MFERVKTSLNNNGEKVKSITVKVKINTPSGKGPWKIADIQLQEGSVATEYTEHVAEMERVKEKRT